MVKTPHEFVLSALHAFQEATGCDTTDQLKTAQRQEAGEDARDGGEVRMAAQICHEERGMRDAYTVINQWYYDEGWGQLAKDALGIEPLDVESQARRVARYAAARIAELEAAMNDIGRHFSSDWPETCQEHVRLARRVMRPERLITDP